MPTGYTIFIEDGKIDNGNDFIIKCARAFGACIEMKDESLSKEIPKEFEVSPYYKYKLAETRAELKMFKNMSNKDIQKKIDNEYESNIVKRLEDLRKYQEIRDRYNKVRNEIEAWNPPTSEHINLKEFALNQIDISIEFDMVKLIEDELRKPKVSLEDYKTNKIKSLEDDIYSYGKYYDEEVYNVNKRNKWIKDLRDSLKMED